MTAIQIPAPDELRGRLNGLELLLTVTKWERAALVFAYTEAQTNKGHGTRPGVAPPRMNIRNFAGQGYHGLSTPKSVARYRQAWETAISNGWAVPVAPGDRVVLPDEPFPAWPYGEGTTWEDHAQPELRPDRTPQRPMTRVYGSLERAATALRQLGEAMAEDPLDEEGRAELVARLTALRQGADEALAALAPVPV